MQELIDHAINQADNNKVGVVYLDLDNFKRSTTPMGIYLVTSYYATCHWLF